MLMNLRIKIPANVIIEASKELQEDVCLRKEVIFEQWKNDKWKYSLCCDGYGNGYGVSMPCKFGGKYDLKITDLSKCKPIKGCSEDYLIQDEYYNER